MALMHFEPDPVLDETLDRHIAYLVKAHMKNQVEEARAEDKRRSGGEDE